MRYYIFLLILFVSLSCSTMCKTETIITGVALNAKNGAILVTEDKESYYIDNLDYWDDSIYGKKIIVKGTLIIEKDSTSVDDNLITQSFEPNAEIKILKNIKWEFDTVK